MNEATFKPTPTDLAWMAGFFDGEGSIFISNPKPRQFSLQIRVTQIVDRPLLILAAAFGGTIGLRDNGGFGKRQIYQWSLTSERAARFLGTLLPYLIVKKDEAELALGYWRNKPRPHRGHPSTDFEVAEAMSFRLALMEYHGGPR